MTKDEAIKLIEGHILTIGDGGQLASLSSCAFNDGIKLSISYIRQIDGIAPEIPPANCSQVNSCPYYQGGGRERCRDYLYTCARELSRERRMEYEKYNNRHNQMVEICNRLGLELESAMIQLLKRNLPGKEK